MLYVHQRTGEEYELQNKIANKVRLKSLATGNIRKVTEDQLNDFFYHYINEEECEVTDLKESEEATYVQNLVEGIEWEMMWNGVNQEYAKNFTPAPKPKKPKKKKVKEPEVKVTKPNKGKKEKVTKTTTGETVKLKDLCKDPSKARRILRKYPDLKSGKWEWSDPKQIKKVKELLKGV